MKIIFDRVTTFSKILAVVLFVSFVSAAFYFGFRYGTITTSVDKATQIALRMPAISNYASPISSWVQYKNEADKFGIRYPFYLEEILPTESPTVLLNLKLGRLFEIGTNFSEAQIKITRNTGAISLENCLKSEFENEKQRQEIINNIPFIVFENTDAGAGNYYDTQTYKTVKNGTCYGIETVMHSTAIGNWPAEYAVKPFNRDRVNKLLTEIVSTFYFE